MPPRPKTAERSIEKMLTSWAETPKSPRTITHYREHCLLVVAALREGERNTLPWLITRLDVKWLLEEYERRGLTIATRKNYIHALRRWTEFYDNYVVAGMGIRWPRDGRPNADWLDHDEAVALLRLPKTAPAELVVHCELCLGMRRIEVLRLTVDSFRGRYVEILGKGSLGGKPRLMPYHRDTKTVLDRYMNYRNGLIKAARRTKAEAPADLLIYRQKLTLKTYSDSGIDRMLERLADELGYNFSNHTLRRTFGRVMYRSGVQPATISRMLGHESIDMTLGYIGVDLDDMNGAMQEFKL